MPLQILELPPEPLVAKAEVTFCPRRASAWIRLAPGSQAGPAPYTLCLQGGARPRRSRVCHPSPPAPGAPTRPRCSPSRGARLEHQGLSGPDTVVMQTQGIPSGKEELSSRLRPEDGAERGPALTTLGFPAPSHSCGLQSPPTSRWQVPLSPPRRLAASRPPCAAPLRRAGRASEQGRGTAEGSQPP